jgi:hypothetical protein
MSPGSLARTRDTENPHPATMPTVAGTSCFSLHRGGLLEAIEEIERRRS